MEESESKRIHLDWWGECRTCRFWGSKDRFDINLHGICNNSKSSLYNEETWTAGCCNEWDSFDLEAAVEIMIQEELTWKKK